MPKPSRRDRRRAASRDGAATAPGRPRGPSSAFERGLPRRAWQPPLRGDLYHWFLTQSWPSLIALLAAAYLAINLAFALLYLLDPGGIAQARRGSLLDAFFFSVQTMATIGYGTMSPASLYANLLVTLESVAGLLSFALATGLIFTRFSRPVARVVFSQVAVVAPHEGVPTLMFRMANERRNQILQAEVRVTLLRNEWSREGIYIRRQRDLALAREQSSFFNLSWLVMHPIDATSPLHGATAESLRESETALVVLLTGVDETLNQTVHARNIYPAEGILWDRQFADIVVRAPDQSFAIDMARFHDTLPLSGGGA